MAAPSGLIEFFVLEASEYIERLDALLLNAAPAGPDGEAIQRTARALRGSATMAKLGPFAELAATMERVGRGTRQGLVTWNAGLKAAMGSAVDDLKILLRAARTWGEGETQRALARAQELAAHTPGVAPASTQPDRTSPAPD